MFAKTYWNKSGKSFSEGRRFSLAAFYAYYNTLTDKEWDRAIKMAAKKGYDISNIKPYIRVYSWGTCFAPMEFEEIREKLLKMHGFNGIVPDDRNDIAMICEKRRGVEWLYASLGVPVPDYWKEKSWD